MRGPSLFSEEYTSRSIHLLRSHPLPINISSLCLAPTVETDPMTACVNCFVDDIHWKSLAFVTKIMAWLEQASASKVLQETCNYIRSLHREVDDLSERLSELLASSDTDSDQAAIIRSLLM